MRRTGRRFTHPDGRTDRSRCPYDGATVSILQHSDGEYPWARDYGPVYQCPACYARVSSYAGGPHKWEAMGVPGDKMDRAQRRRGHKLAACLERMMAALYMLDLDGLPEREAAKRARAALAKRIVLFRPDASDRSPHHFGDLVGTELDRVVAQLGGWVEDWRRGNPWSMHDAAREVKR